jgi:hypothetical protein
MVDEIDDDIWSSAQDSSLQLILCTIRNTLGGVLRAFSYLEATGFSSGGYSIIVHPSKPDIDVVHIVPIGKGVLERLEDLVLKASIAWEAPTAQAAAENRSISLLQSAIIRVLAYIGFTFHGTDSLLAQCTTTRDTREKIIPALADLVYILAFGLASYSGSHASSLLEAGSAEEGSIVRLKSQHFKLETVRLACLNRFIGGPVWVFSEIGDWSCNSIPASTGA